MLAGSPLTGGMAPTGEVPMRLGVRLLLGLGMAALAAAVPSNRWLLGYAAVALLAMAPRGPLLVEPVVQGQPAVHGDVLAGDIARPGVAGRNRATRATSAGTPAWPIGMRGR